MMYKKSKIFYGMFAGTLLCLSSNINADIHLQNAFLYGDNIEVGLGPDGAFGSDVVSPDIGKKAHGKKLGFISDPTGNKFQSSYHGDFFLPGWSEEGWGVSFNDKAYNNNSHQQGAEVIGALSNFNKTDYAQSVTWKGETEGLEITQVYRIYKAGTAIVIDVSLKNTTSSVMTDVYYMRTVDPDNNAEQALGDSALNYTTTNSIIAQGSDGNGGSAVSAMQAADANGKFTQSLLVLNGYGENSRVTYGGVSNRDPVEVYTGSTLLKQAGVNTADEAISIAFKYDQIKPGDTVTLRTGYQLKDIPTASIDMDADNSSGASGNGFTQLYILGTTAQKVVDTDMSITGSGFSEIEQAIITISNPHTNDKLDILGTLPTGISLDSTASTDTEIHLTGTASKTAYQTALKQVQFSNDDTKSSTETRKVTLQIIDDNATPSNAAVSTIKVTVPVVLNDPKIAGDDIVNDAEDNKVPLSGHAAPNATVMIDFTDKDGKKLAPPKTVTADDNGNWTLGTAPADISSLSDGPIKVLVTATDPNGNKSSLLKNIIKDTTIILTDITPTDNQIAPSTTPTFDGKTDPNATVTLKILPNGKTYTKVADSEGKWSIPLDEQKMGETISVQISAKDEAANEADTQQKLIIPSLPIEITDLDTNDKGVANSTTPTFKGTSNPNTTITVKIPTSNGDSKTCTTTTDADGEWVCKMPEVPSGGPYTVTVTTKDGDGNTNATSKPITIPDLPLIIDSPVDKAVVSGIKPTVSGTSKPGTDITVTTSDGKKCTAVTDDTNHWSCELPTLPADSTFTLTVTSEDDIGNKVTEVIDISTDKLPLSIIAPKDNSIVEDTTPIFTGTTAPNTDVIVTMATGQECKTKSDAMGHWSCELPALPVGGPYDVTVKAKDPDGNETSISEQISVPKIPLVITSPTDGEKITGTSVIVAGTSDANKPIMVLGPDGESCETTSDENGAWSCQLDNLQSGDNKRITVLSGGDSNGKQVSLLAIDIENSAAGVKTILTGGGGSASFPILFLLGLVSLFNRYRKRINN